MFASSLWLYGVFLVPTLLANVMSSHDMYKMQIALYIPFLEYTFTAPSYKIQIIV